MLYNMCHVMLCYITYTKLRIRLFGSILMLPEFAGLRQACGDLFFFNTKFCLALSFILHVFERERIVTVPTETGIFGLIIFSQNEKHFIRYMLSA